MKNLPRHICIALAAGLFAFMAIPQFFLHYQKDHDALSLPFVPVFFSAAIWLTFSLLTEKPTLKKWLILGFISPFIGIPLVYALTVSGPRGSLINGFQIALFMSWIWVPGGLLMGLIAHLICNFFNPAKASK